MAGRMVLAVTDDAEEADTLESSLHVGEPVTVRPLADSDDLFETLCYEVVDCLLLPATVDDTPATRVAYGVRGLFPDLPIVVVGLSPADVPGELSVTAVDAETLSDPPVADALATALDGAPPPAAARPPSRMETLLLSMFDQFPVHLYAKDAGARHVLTSRYAQEPLNLVGMTDLEYDELPPAHRAAAYRDDIGVIEDDDPLLEVEEYTDYIDSHSLTSKVPWYGPDGDVVGLAGMTRDITERKHREHAARRQHELLVKMALVTAHEFRNELQVAQGRLELVMDDPAQIDVIDTSHERLSRIVDTVINLASRERHERNPHPVWLSTISREVWDTLETESATLAFDEDIRFVADPQSTSLLLQILLSNAIEHGGPDVTVTVGATDVGFIVADDGPGIDVDPPEHVFDAGFTTCEGNTGFGLYVARSIAAEHGWTISLADSREGAAFTIAGIVEPDD